MKNPKISVIMSTYNEPIKWLKESIDSILNQTFGDFEFIIINDNPKRKDLQVELEKYQKKDKRIKFIKNKKNLGLTKSLNQGLKMAKGKYIARMDADDISLNTRFEIQHNYLEKQSDIFLVGSGATFIDEKGNFLLKNIPPITHKKIIERFKIKNCLLHPTIMMRNEEKLKYREKLLYVEDYDFYLNLATKGKKLFTMNKILLKCRISKNSIRHKKAFHQKLFAEKAREFYFQRLSSGKDSYNQFSKTSILKKNPKNKEFEKDFLQTKIKTNFSLGKYKNSRKFIKRYFKNYGWKNKFFYYYISTFLGENIIKATLKIMPTSLLRKLNN
jgi:glycosyltransferase involved in cell wall biosynthesis